MRIRREAPADAGRKAVRVAVALALGAGCVVLAFALLAAGVELARHLGLPVPEFGAGLLLDLVRDGAVDDVPRGPGRLGG